LKLTADIYEASRGIFATAELLVKPLEDLITTAVTDWMSIVCFNACVVLSAFF